MSYNGSGTFVLNVGGYPYIPNTTILSANVNALLQDIANGLSLAVTRDGQMVMTGPLHMGGNLIDGISAFTATGTGGVFTGDFTNATLTSRAYLQTSTGNGISNVGVLPNGAATSSTLSVFNNSTPTNAGVGQLGVDASNAWLTSTITGAGTQLPLQFRIAGTTYGTLSTGGAWTLAAPASGNTLFINTLSGSNTAVFNAGDSQGVFNVAMANAAGSYITTAAVNSTGFQLTHNSAARTMDFGTNATVRLSITGGGVVNYNADGSSAIEVGFRDIPQNQIAAPYIFVLADRGKMVVPASGTANMTIPANGTTAFPVGTAISITNASGGARTIAITTDTLIWVPSGGTGTRTIGFQGQCTLWKQQATVWYISGSGLT